MHRSTACRCLQDLRASTKIFYTQEGELVGYLFGFRAFVFPWYLVIHTLIGHLNLIRLVLLASLLSITVG